MIPDSDETVIVEGNHYFPIASVRDDVLRHSVKHTTCAWKGEASYFSLEVDAQVNEDAAWTYPAPKAGAAQFADHVAFRRGVEITG